MNTINTVKYLGAMILLATAAQSAQAMQKTTGSPYQYTPDPYVLELCRTSQKDSKNCKELMALMQQTSMKVDEEKREAVIRGRNKYLKAAYPCFDFHPISLEKENKPASFLERLKTSAMLVSIPGGIGIAGIGGLIFGQKFPKTTRAAATCAQFGLSAGLVYLSTNVIAHCEEIACDLKEGHLSDKKRNSEIDFLKDSQYWLLGSAAASYALCRRGFTNATMLKNMIKNK